MYDTPHKLLEKLEILQTFTKAFDANVIKKSREY
jgi:hypothetical protein